MRSGAVNLGLRPLFYDSLLGDFYVEGPVRAAHNLGHLAIETFMKQDRSFNIEAGFGNITGQQFRLRPGWAPQIESTIKCDMSGEFPTLSGISLRRTNQELLTITAVLGNDTTGCEIAKNGNIPEILSLELGESLSRAADYIAWEAAALINA